MGHPVQPQRPHQTFGGHLSKFQKKRNGPPRLNLVVLAEDLGEFDPIEFSDFF